VSRPGLVTSRDRPQTNTDEDSSKSTNKTKSDEPLRE